MLLGINEKLKNLVYLTTKDKSQEQGAKIFHNIKGRIFLDILRVLCHMALALSKSHDSKGFYVNQKANLKTLLPILLIHYKPKSHSIMGPNRVLFVIACIIEGFTTTSTQHNLPIASEKKL